MNKRETIKHLEEDNTKMKNEIFSLYDRLRNYKSPTEKLFGNPAKLAQQSLILEKERDEWKKTYEEASIDRRIAMDERNKLANSLGEARKQLKKIEKNRDYYKEKATEYGGKCDVLEKEFSDAIQSSLAYHRQADTWHTKYEELIKDDIKDRERKEEYPRCKELEEIEEHNARLSKSNKGIYPKRPNEDMVMDKAWLFDHTNQYIEEYNARLRGSITAKQFKQQNALTCTKEERELLDALRDCTEYIEIDDDNLRTRLNEYR